VAPCVQVAHLQEIVRVKEDVIEGLEAEVRERSIGQCYRICTSAVGFCYSASVCMSDAGWQVGSAAM
jgi:hypothetical protein